MARQRERSAVELIRKLQDGSINSLSLSTTQRRECVALLMFEGLSVSEIACKVGRCDRTIRRDLQKVRAHNALHPSTDLQAEILGFYKAQVEAAMARLTKLSRDSTASAAEKIDAIRSGVEMYDRFVQRLTSVGLLGCTHSEPHDARALIELTQVIGVVANDLGEDSPLAHELQSMMRRIGGTDATSS